MSRHFVVEIRAVLPGEDDQKEEEDLSSLLEAIGRLPEFQVLRASIGEPYQT
jgi:hypothetical protein